MSKHTEIKTGWAWFLSAPETRTLTRRGDPLGLRNITNEAADLLAPGLTNRTIDARWLSVLSWALVHSRNAWNKAGGSALSTAQERAGRYDWLRPLELLWVRRSMYRGGAQYRALQWPGYRSVRDWDMVQPHFGMTDRQRKNHRQLGAYGAYRVVLRTARFTYGGDGWTPDEDAKRLARHVDTQLELDDALPAYTRRPNVDPATWWLHKGWPNWRGGAANRPFILSSSTPIKKLSAVECNVLSGALFDDEARARCAQAIGDVTASDYVSLCKKLAVTLPAKGGDARLRSLGLLAQLNATGVDVLRTTASVMVAGEDALDRIARYDEVASALDAFTLASRAWNEAKHDQPFEFVGEADRLAKVGRARGRAALLNGFLDHHLRHGTGVPWVARSDGNLYLDGARSGTLAGGFGYRLHALSNLAYQCGLIDRVPTVLRDTADHIGSED